MPPVLEISSLAKSYGTLRAVDGVSFSVDRGSCTGLLGPNGAGKSTTIAMIMGLLPPDSGMVKIDGAALSGDGDSRKCLLGLVPQDLALYEELTALENLQFFGALYGLRGPALTQRMDSVLGIAGLQDRSRERVSRYSGGMKRRLNLAAALLHDPQILLLDEPTVGVDPQSRNGIFEAIETLRAAGKTILYTTHYMEEVERLCERVVIMDHGRVIADDTVANLKARGFSGSRLILETETPLPLPLEALLSQHPAVGQCTVAGHRLEVESPDLTRAAAAVLEVLQAHRVSIAHVRTESASLEHVFLALTGRHLRDP